MKTQGRILGAKDSSQDGSKEGLWEVRSGLTKTKAERTREPGVEKSVVKCCILDIARLQHT